MIFQKHIQMFITKKIKQKYLIVAMNPIIAEKKNFKQRHIKDILKIAKECLVLFIILMQKV